MKEPRKAALNALILTAIVLIYVLMMSPVVHITVAGINPAYRGGDRSAVALECVVNWDAAAVEPMLAYLNEKDIRATFFVSADWALRNPKLLKRMAGDGHELGCYGGIAEGDKDMFRDDIVRVRATISAQCGVSSKLYMPMSEAVPNACMIAAREEEMLCVLYSLDLQSARASSPEWIVERALKNPFGGAIIRFAPTAHMLSALPDIVDKLRENGFMLRPVGEILGTRII